MERLTTLRARVDWAKVIPTAAPFAAYGIIMALVAIFGEA
jgi:hypothetical protein